jgi:hypothetical protein
MKKYGMMTTLMKKVVSFVERRAHFGENKDSPEMRHLYVHVAEILFHVLKLRARHWFFQLA